MELGSQHAAQRLRLEQHRSVVLRQSRFGAVMRWVGPPGGFITDVAKIVTIMVIPVDSAVQLEDLRLTTETLETNAMTNVSVKVSAVVTAATLRCGIGAA